MSIPYCHENMPVHLSTYELSGSHLDKRSCMSSMRHRTAPEAASRVSNPFLANADGSGSVPSHFVDIAASVNWRHSL